ncbi:MAG: DNA polymerase III subunit chi [Rubrivivax sp. SCN 70-15]|nr:MAG: DNA polymerase III subunit chi [Rubrivivax sp. SCN 70-15]
MEFHTGVADPLAFACRLLRKAYRRGARVLVTAPAVQLEALDRALWTFDERDFVPHLRLTGGAGAALAARTPIWLTDGPPPPDGPEVLVNLGAAVADELAPFTRVIEIVAADADAEQAGRARWREYRARGLAVTHHVASHRD